MKQLRHLLTASTAAILLAAAGCQAGADSSAGRTEMTIGENIIMPSLDSDEGFSGYTLMAFGIAEALMRVTPDYKLEPWVAESAKPVDAKTFKLTIRDDVTFWDGSEVDASAVKESLERSMKAQPGTAHLLPPGTRFDAAGQELTITTPKPVGTLLNSLAAFNFAIKKVGDDGDPVYTGPYRYADFVADKSITLKAYPKHRTPPKLDRILVRYIPDEPARVLALQSGDIDMAQGILPSSADQLKSGNFKVHQFPFGRQNDLVLNVKKAPLNDPKVRRAISLAVDRKALVDGVMGGAATPAYAMGPENIGIPDLVRTQRYDLAEAKRLLDEAGWRPGAGGVRAKDGKQLRFAITYYTSRAELEALSTVIKDQLRKIGVDVSLEVSPDIGKTAQDNSFDAMMYSYNIAPFGEIGRAISTFYTPSSTNQNRYQNKEADALFKRYQASFDAAERRDLVAQIQKLVAEDTPVVYLVNPYQLVATASAVSGYTPHPLENYKIDSGLGFSA